jgi:hypothetical protein
LQASTNNGHVFSLSIGKLIEAKKLALKRRLWFKNLSRVECGIIDLTVRYVATIKSIKLANVVTAILSKLQSANESIVDKLVKKVGLALARKISEIAVNWGNHLASKWAEDHAFARYLAFNVDKK